MAWSPTSVLTEPDVGQLRSSRPTRYHYPRPTTTIQLCCQLSSTAHGLLVISASPSSLTQFQKQVKYQCTNITIPYRSAVPRILAWGLEGGQPMGLTKFWGQSPLAPPLHKHHCLLPLQRKVWCNPSVIRPVWTKL